MVKKTSRFRELTIAPSKAYLYDFRVSGAASTDLLIGRIFDLAAHVAGFHFVTPSISPRFPQIRSNLREVRLSPYDS